MNKETKKQVKKAIVLLNQAMETLENASGIERNDYNEDAFNQTNKRNQDRLELSEWLDEQSGKISDVIETLKEIK